VVVDLYDLSFHAFTRAFHTAGVPIATVVTSSNAVTSVIQPSSFQLPPNPIAPAVTKLRSGAAITILAIGDSITAGTGGTPTWYNLAFNSANSGSGYNVPNAANVTLTRFALPGGNSAMAMLAMANIFTSTAGAWDSDSIDQGLAGLPGWEVCQIMPDAYVGQNKLAAAAPDVVIISLGTNDDGNTFQNVEASARYFRKLGSSVIIATCNSRYDGYSNNAPAGTEWQKIATANGLAVCDTREFMEEAYQNYLAGSGSTPYLDGVHPSNSGQTLWARAFTGLFNSYAQTATLSALPYRRVAAGTSVRSSPAAHLQLVFSKTSSTGTGTTSYTSDNLRVNWAGIPTTNGFITVTSSQFIRVCFPYVSGQIYGIFENQSGENFTYSLQDTSGNVMATNTINGISLPFLLTPIATAAQVQTFASTFSRYTTAKNKGLPVSTGFRFLATSGTAKVVGFLFETPVIEQVPMGNVKLLGTWITEDADPYIAGYNDSPTTGIRVPKVYTSNTTWDRIAVEANDCDILSPVVRVGQSSGRFTIYADGLTPFSSFDTYQSVGNFPMVLQFPVATGSWPTYSGASSAALPLSVARRRRNLTMQVVGVNTNAAATSTGIGRFTLIGVDALKMD
jgi:lysophospholipase L1-like esterase